ncbi:MAG: hypothetical protein ACI4S2_04250 [Lachnospiraceae bacterium]
MKNKVLVLLSALVFIIVLGVTGCGRNSLIEGTYVHSADEVCGELIIVHDGGKVSVEYEGQKFEAEMKEDNVIIVEGQYEILETYCDEDGNPDIENCKIDRVRACDAQALFGDDVVVDGDGVLEVSLEKQ